MCKSSSLRREGVLCVVLELHTKFYQKYKPSCFRTKMAGNEETRSSLVEGLEHFSEEEQLKMALELSKHDAFGSSNDLGTANLPSSTNMSVDSFQSATSGFEFDDWIRTPAEDRLQLLTGTGGTAGEGNSANVIGSISEADKEVSVDNDEVDEDELLKKNIEEKAKVALGPSKLETASNNPIDMPEDKQLAGLPHCSFCSLCSLKNGNCSFVL